MENQIRVADTGARRAPCDSIVTVFLFQVKNNLLLNNQLAEDKLGPGLQHQPLRKIVNNLANENTTACNKCKESQTSNKSAAEDCANNNCQSAAKTKQQNQQPAAKGGIVNLAFVDAAAEAASWYQPHLPRHLAAQLLADCPVGSFVVRNSQSQMGAGSLALTVRVPRSFNGCGLLHYLILVTEAGFRIKGFSKVFSSLFSLVTHHSVMKEHLPCRLLVDTEATSDPEDGDSDKESDFADLDADPEYPGILRRLREQLGGE